MLASELPGSGDGEESDSGLCFFFSGVCLLFPVAELYFVLNCWVVNFVYDI